MVVRHQFIWPCQGWVIRFSRISVNIHRQVLCRLGAVLYRCRPQPRNYDCCTMPIVFMQWHTDNHSTSRRGAVVKGVEHISTNLLVNI